MIFGTAGHVDHGKTSLVTALTGVDTDRLPEEKRRGITLELGFAPLTFPDGSVASVIDVPGHEKLVRAMAAGAGGIDAAILVVAADEGVMAQTREHVDVLRLLGVERAVVVITKSDLIDSLDAEWNALVAADVAELAAKAFRHVTTLSVSAKTGAGLAELKQTLAAQAAATRADRGPTFLPIDRAFSLKGFGCVVTGTLWSGRVQLDELLALAPGGLDGLRVRSLQVHGRAVTEAKAGQRVAVNLVGVDTEQVSRGMVLVRPGELPLGKALDVELQLLPSAPKPLPARSRQLLVLGTAQHEVSVRLLEHAELRPGETTFAQLRGAAPLVALPRQRFVLRGTTTIAGGTVLALTPKRRKRGSASSLQQLAHAELEPRLRWLLTEAGYRGHTEHELVARAAAGPREVHDALLRLAARGEVVKVDAERFLGGAVHGGLQARARALLEPVPAGLPREELRQRLGVEDERVFARVLVSTVFEPHGELVRLAGRAAPANPDEALLRTLQARLESAGLAPPTPAELATALQLTPDRATQLLRKVVGQGGAVRAGPLFFATRAVEALEAKVRQHFAVHPQLSTLDFKALVGGSRKFVIPLAELLDERKLTLRVGESRVLRQRANRGE